MLEKSLIQKIDDPVLEKSQIQASMLRIDQIHPVVSGNKLFKLTYYLKEATEKNKKGIITFGGAFSNHLVATAFAAKEKGLQSIGFVRGESNEALTPTLSECISYGMELRYISRQEFNQIDHAALKANYPDFIFIPQGGYGMFGAKGASEILHINNTSEFTYILAACGTGTMGAGLINASEQHQKTILISTLKNNFSIQQEVDALLTETGRSRTYQILFQYHMGGYAKKNSLVLNTMNSFYREQGIPTDFVYTGKMIYAFYELLQLNCFEKGSKILLIHSGGLQGNRSLHEDELIF